MSNGDVLRQADEKESLAARFDGYAENLVTLLEEVKRGGGNPVWTGLAAQRFDHETAQRRAEVDRLAEQCRKVARNLRNSAQRLRQQARNPGAPF